MLTESISMNAVPLSWALRLSFPPPPPHFSFLMVHWHSWQGWHRQSASTQQGHCSDLTHDWLLCFSVLLLSELIGGRGGLQSNREKVLEKVIKSCQSLLSVPGPWLWHWMQMIWSSILVEIQEGFWHRSVRHKGNSRLFANNAGFIITFLRSLSPHHSPSFLFWLSLNAFPPFFFTF